jgi:hypothetical protein
LGEPLRQREVMQRHPRLDAVLAQRREDPAVVLDRRRVDAPLLRLEATPLDRQPVRRVTEEA